MSRLLVVDASPLISLAKVGHLDLLEKLSSSVMVPEAVVTEVLAGSSADPARTALESGWGCRLAVGRAPDDILEWGLGAGETAVLTATRHLAAEDATAVIDDAQARQCARTLSVPLIGTLGLVLRACLQGRIPAARPVLLRLRDAGLRLDDATVRAALAKTTGESW